MYAGERTDSYLESETSLEMAANRSHFLLALEKGLDVVNPLEALGDIFSEAEAGLAGLLFVLIFAIGLIAIAIVLGGIWVAIQEAFLSGGPPQGLGLG
jgi:hypothetical protein